MTLTSVLFLTSLLSLATNANLSDTDDSTQQVVPLNCSMTTKIINYSFEKHFRYYKMTPQLADLVLKRFQEQLLASYGMFLTAKDIRAMTYDLAHANRKQIAKDLTQSNCVYFEKQMARVAAGFLALSSGLPSSEDDLTRALVIYRDSPKVDDLTAIYLANLSEQVELWKQDTPIIEAARYVARSSTTALADFGDKLSELVYEELLQAFTWALDPHSSYIPERNKIVRNRIMQSGYFGVGTAIESHPYGIKITGLIDGGTAQKSGKIKANQIIVAVDGKATIMEPLRTSISRIKGPENTQVTLTIADLDESGALINTHDIKLTRGEIQKSSTGIKITQRQVRGKNIVTIALEEFYFGSATDMAEKILEIRKNKQIDALILDLRNNLGGSLYDAQRTIGMFVTPSYVVAMKNNFTQVHEDDTKDMVTVYTGPLLVAVNNASASASEAVAGSLLDFRRAIIVGSKHTYGKGSVQSPIDNRDVLHMPGTLMLTHSLYFTAGGDSPQCIGIETHIQVPGPLGFSEKERECAAYPNAIPGDSLNRPVYQWQEYKANHDPKLATITPILAEQSKLRLSAEANPTAEEQLSEIEEIAADFATLKAAH